ncbi:cation diffusion facilitator CzcD-associated flavoprotein CzcO [Litorivivens lipolytica]|uniref:Cation diffusion facilitator CzcD-associated flavoprotein CzcO n=1 Tax=Litorivivens lipolytica TaxID=1524264 RepID=A0A7W4Z5H6_9GAMM|nr:NAD(P)/FAD-dependent oxidoreductase [Litorivivens lipolytica]MBB3047223.1 cation diffusion facilitator CzcD-associated flavoprotein CzcO [Litorivivens lipolytica]
MKEENAKVIIIGSGFAGLGMAINLKKAGVDDFILLERAEDVGGAWRDNHYPGCACDVESLLYSFSFEPKRDWTRKFAESGEIYDYLRHCARKYGIYPHIRFSRSMASAEFDEHKARWNLRDDNDNRYSCQFLVSALGPLSNPVIPDFKGLESFGGPAFHSAHWDHTVDLTNKHVAIVGSGASTIQFLPKVAEQAASVTLFQRTAPWVMPKLDRPFTEREHRLFRRFPLYQKLWRSFIYWRAELFLNGLLNTDNWLHKRAEKLIGKYLAHQIPDAQLREKVRPKFALGCKRTLLSNDYYPALMRDNVAVVDRGVQSVTATGVVDADGVEHSADAILFGTGFRVDDPLSGISVRGLDGRNLNDEWRSNAFSSYYGTTVSGYPNLLVLAGPNTGIGHTSLVYMLEQQIGYAMKYIRLADSVENGYLNVKPDVQQLHQENQQASFKGTAWASGCDSWYLTQGGKNFTIWPTFTFRYARALKQLRRQHYVLHSASGITGQEALAQ